MMAEVRVFPDPAALSRAAADGFARAAQEAVSARGRYLVCLSGGSTPLAAFRLLAGAEYAALPWGQMFFFWGDERCVPPEHPESNFGQAHNALLSHAAVPPEHVLRVPGERPAAEAAIAYAKIMRQFAAPGLDWPIFDLVWLGLGADGHTASLFPGSASQNESTAAALPVTAEYHGRPAERVTLTLPVFNAARQVTFLAAGAEKAPVLARILAGAAPDLPAARVNPASGTLTWLVDDGAVSVGANQMPPKR